MDSKQSKGKIYVLILLIAIAGAVTVLFLRSIGGVPLRVTGPVACTMEAKICPDGSAVGRSGPKCEFAQCPSLAASGSALRVGEERKIGDVSITLNSITQDSRCASDVQCIWAGAVTVNVKLADALHSEVADISSNLSPHIFGGNKISIISVAPAPVSTKAILKSDYIITFHVEKVVTKQEATVKGMVTLSPTCPVERIPPDPNCAPKPYRTAIQVFLSDGTELVKTLQSQSDGSFTFTLPFGDYTILAGAGEVLPRCAPTALMLRTANPSPVNISCDTGIR